jgi:hypothetical protein
MQDRQLAKILGLSPGSVGNARKRRGIPAYSARSPEERCVEFVRDVFMWRMDPERGGEDVPEYLVTLLRQHGLVES